MIGCGGMGMTLVKNLLKGRPDLKLVALCDPREWAINETHKTIEPTAKVYADYRDLVNAPEVDFVMIASWNAAHAEQTIAAFRAGKNVFCQKPLATTFEDCLAMKSAWESSGRAFAIGLTLRFSPHYRKIKQLIDEGAIGRIISLDFTETLAFEHGGFIFSDWRIKRANSGPILLEKCCHDIDLVNWMTGSVPSRVASFGGLNFFTPENEGQILRVGPDKEGRPPFSVVPERGLNPFTSEKEIVDNQVTILEYHSGVRAAFHLNFCSAIPERRMHIVGSEGTIRADVIEGKIQLQRIGWDTRIEDVSSDASGGHGGGDPIIARELYDCIRHEASPAAGFMEGLKSAIICFAIDEAMLTGQVVHLAPYWKRAGLTA